MHLFVNSLFPHSEVTRDEWKSARKIRHVLVWFLVGRLRLLVLAMRHKNTQTTEQFYARIRRDAAFFEIERAFERPVKVR